jgi:succinate dehydrogenase hydrophobic anchor subunit
MTGQTQPNRRFLGRPDAAHPGFIPGEDIAFSPARRAERPHAGRLWLVQALSGATLVVLLGVHLVAQHVLAPGGLRDYSSVVDYLRNPIALVAELALLAAVIVHAVTGLRAAFVDVFGAVGLRRITIVLVGVGTIAFAYAMWLTLVVISGPAQAS